LREAGRGASPLSTGCGCPRWRVVPGSAVRGLGRAAPRARSCEIASVFDFRGILAAYELSEFRDHGPGRSAAGTTRTKRGPRGPGPEAGNAQPTGTGPGTTAPDTGLAASPAPLGPAPPRLAVRLCGPRGAGPRASPGTDCSRYALAWLSRAVRSHCSLQVVLPAAEALIWPVKLPWTVDRQISGNSLPRYDRGSFGADIAPNDTRSQVRGGTNRGITFKTTSVWGLFAAMTHDHGGLSGKQNAPSG
jgi:hypothetical protein